MSKIRYTFTILTSTLYLMYFFAIKQRRISIISLCASFSGLIMIFIVSVSPFDDLARRSFLLHRIQHTVLHHLAPFLLVLGKPPGWDRVTLRLKRFPILMIISDNPIVSGTVFIGLIVLWLAPAIHVLAMTTDTGFWIMNGSMLINGLMFWALALNGRCFGEKRLSPAKRILLLLAIVPPQVLIGSVIAFAPDVLYVNYALCEPVFGSLTLLQSQQLGGLVLWIPAGMMSVIGVLTIIGRDFLLLSGQSCRESA